VARVDLGIGETEFGRMSPRDLHAYHARHAQALKRWDLLAGVLASVTANFGFCRPAKPLSAADFFPSLRDESARADQLSPEEQISALRTYFRGMAVKAPKG
jgi:hypothetical protein